MSAREREIVVDIGGGKGEGLIKEAQQRPETDFYVVDPELHGINPEFDNLHFIDHLVDFNAQLPFPRKSVSRVNINFLMGEVRSSCVDMSRASEKAMYGMILDEATRVLRDDGEIQIQEVQRNFYPVRELLQKRRFYLIEPPIIAARGDTEFADLFLDHFVKAGKSATESNILPIKFTVKKDLLLEAMCPPVMR